MTLEEVDVARHREITSKAVSAVLILLLKWFKASRAHARSLSLSQPQLIGCPIIYARRPQVSASIDTTYRLKLFASGAQNVWPTRAIVANTVQTREGGLEVSPQMELTMHFAPS